MRNEIRMRWDEAGVFDANDSAAALRLEEKGELASFQGLTPLGY
jgi:hypothetical protein